MCPPAQSQGAKGSKGGKTVWVVGEQQKPTPDPKSEKTIFGKEPSRWAARDYAVRASIVHDVITHFGVQPTWDGFANAENKRFHKWWGPGSLYGEDAFEQNWAEEVNWMNPLFDLFPIILENVSRDQAHVLLVLPGWERKNLSRCPKAQHWRSEIPQRTQNV